MKAMGNLYTQAQTCVLSKSFDLLRLGGSTDTEYSQVHQAKDICDSILLDPGLVDMCELCSRISGFLMPRRSLLHG